MLENVIQIKFGITINVDVSAKLHKKMCMQKIYWNIKYIVIFGILLHEVVKMVDMQEALLMIQ